MNRQTKRLRLVPLTLAAALLLGLGGPAGAALADPGTSATGEAKTAEWKAFSHLPAFPGAEGAGMYTTGGRGGEVYEVTNLNDSGPGSFRDAVSQGNRIVVFRVSGVIHLKSKLNITGSNLTIAGQTAPGDGISLHDYPVFLKADNVIIRYLRFRMGDTSGAADDALSVRGQRNIIIDHCSFNWAIDEVLSPYQNSNVTVQWSIAGEALTMSIHKKGRHGFGGLWGSGSSYHHNLLIHNASRNARFKGPTDTHSDPVIDYRNNVIYNWNYLSAYGGDAADINMVNNYYKYGPDTLFSKRSSILEQTGARGKLYIAGNYVDGAPEVTQDNWLGVRNGGKERLDAPVPALPVATETAEEAYERVLAGAGAILPKRDAIDARLIQDVRNRTGRHINTPSEVGGYPVLNSAPAPVDSDRDGMPDEWELAHGLDPFDPSDRNGDWNGDGYTNVEKYLNAIAGSGSLNPEVSLTSPDMHELYGEGAAVVIEARASDPDGKVAKVEFYRNDTKLGEAADAPFRLVWANAPEGTHYVRARAIDDTGTATDSATVPIHVNAEGDIGPWLSRDVGQPGIAGHADLRDGVFTVKGAGNWREDDSFHFVYRELSGDGDIVARIDSITDTTPNNRSGVMLREALTPGAREAMAALSVRGNGYVGVFYSKTDEGAPLGETDPVAGLMTPYWVKLEKRGETISGYISPDGIDWRLLSSAVYPGMDKVYAGLATEAAKEPNLIENYNASRFSQVGLATAPQATIVYSSTEPTEGSVTATLVTEQPVTVTNNGGSSSYTFYWNGSFTFEFVDAAGRRGTATAAVDHIRSASSGLPGKPVLANSQGHAHGLRDGHYEVRMNMWWGHNGAIYKLYENDVLIDTQYMADRSPAAQSAVTEATYRPNGTYRYVAELTNAFGTTRSEPHTVTVSQAAPGEPVLSVVRSGVQGDYEVRMNMWWGTNGTLYRLYENGTLLHTGTLEAATPGAQSAAAAVRGRAAGTYTYTAELENAAGITASKPVTITVSP